jgi:hypothetical protein
MMFGKGYAQAVAPLLEHFFAPEPDNTSKQKVTVGAAGD